MRLSPTRAGARVWPPPSFAKSKATGEVHGPQERITTLEAIRTFTANGAWQDGAEGWKGSLMPGMVADYCVLDGRILDVDPQRIAEIPISTTVVDGSVVFGAFPQGAGR